MIQCHKNILQSGKPCTKVSFIYLPFFRTPAHPALFSALSYPWNSKKQSTLSSHSWETKFNVQLLLLTTLIFSFPKQHVNPKVNSYFVVSWETHNQEFCTLLFLSVFSDWGYVHMWSQTHPHRDRKHWEAVLLTDPELFSSSCKIWRNLRTSLSRVFFPFCVPGSAQVRASCQSQQDNRVPSRIIPQHFPMTAVWFSQSSDGVLAVVRVLIPAFRIKRKFSASSSLVLESVLLSPVGLGRVNHLRVSGTSVFNH